MTDVSFDRLVTFGDSLTDDGLFFGLTSDVLPVGVPPSSAGYDTRFSNGDVYTTVAAGLLGIDDVDALALGSAAAVGTRTLGELINGGVLADLLVDNPDQDIIDFDINLGGQVTRFIFEEEIQPGTAASLLIGLNDYNGFASELMGENPPADPVAAGSALVEEVVGATLGAGVALVFAGVDTIILNTLPTATFFPVIGGFAPPEIQGLGTQIISGQNDALIANSASLTALGAEVIIVDFEALSLEILADQGTFGFLAPLAAPVLLSVGSNPVVIDGPNGPDLFVPQNEAVAALDPDQIAFFDLLHPTESLHGILGSFQAASLTDNVVFEGGEVVGTAEVDLILSGSADDTIALGQSADIAIGGLGNDVIKGQKAADILAGGSGNDVLRGGLGADVLADGAGNDKSAGGRGADVLIDGLGSDVLIGNKAADVFLFTEASLIGGVPGVDQNTFRGGRGQDTLVLALTEDTRAAFEAEADTDAALAALGITTRGIENVVLVDERGDLTDLEVNARLDEADLWGFV